MDLALSNVYVTVVWLGIISVGQAVVGNSAVVRIVAPPLHAQTAETTDFLIADNSLLGKVPWNSKLFNWIVWMPFLIFALQLTLTKNLTDSVELDSGVSSFCILIILKNRWETSLISWTSNVYYYIKMILGPKRVWILQKHCRKFR